MGRCFNQFRPFLQAGEQTQINKKVLLRFSIGDRIISEVFNVNIKYDISDSDDG